MSPYNAETFLGRAMQIREIPGFSEWLPGSGVDNDIFWSSTPETMSEQGITLFYARSSLLGVRKEAIEAIERAQTVVIRALFKGHLFRGSFSALVLHEIPRQSYMTDEFLDGLLMLKPERRPAAVFVLESRLSPVVVSGLTWTSVEQLSDLPALCMESLKAAQVTRHARLPYVFWEWASSSIAAPLIGLQRSIEHAFDCRLAQLQQRYSEMVTVDRRSEQADFLAAIDRVKIQ